MQKRKEYRTGVREVNYCVKFEFGSRYKRKGMEEGDDGNKKAEKR